MHPKLKIAPCCSKPATPCRWDGPRRGPVGDSSPRRRFLEHHCRSRLTREQHHIRIDRCVSQRRIEDCCRSFGQSRNLRDFFGFHVAEIEHHLQGYVRFLLPFGREGNVVGVGADGAVEVVFGHGIKSFPAGGEPPETATGGFGALEAFNSRGRHIQKRYRHRLPLKLERLNKLVFKRLPDIFRHGHAPKFDFRRIAQRLEFQF